MESFAEESPDFRRLKKVPEGGSPRTCAQVFNAFLEQCESRLAKNDLAAVTVASYRKILNGFWRPQIGTLRFLDLRYSTLVKLADDADWSKKTYNNSISVLRRAFKFGYRDHPEKHDPTAGLKSVRIRHKDRPAIDPFPFRRPRRSSRGSIAIGAKRRATTTSSGSSPDSGPPNRWP